MAKYEFYLTDDSGRRITIIKNAAFVSISRAIKGYGTCHIGIPFQDFKVYPPFLPDRRLEVWRSPAHGASLREEGTYLLRKWNVYTREEDNVEIIEFYGRSPIDILRRQSVTSDVLADYQKTDFIDDMMKEIVDENFITPPQTVPTGELDVGGTASLGPSISHTFFAQNVLDILKDLHEISVTMNNNLDTDRRIFFDVVRGSPLNNGGYGFSFRTYADLRGVDRTGEVVFSLENGNIKAPAYYEDHLDSFTEAAILNLTTPAANGSATSPESTLSRWNTIVAAQQSSETTAALNDAKASAFLEEGKSDKSLNATILDSPGSNRQPRSLYGVDWDMGDLLPVQYAGKIFNAEVERVYISVDENGKENIVGMTVPRPLTPEIDQYSVEYLVVAGGGGGGSGDTTSSGGGGGGAGGYLSGAKNLLSGNTYTVTVGAGGAGGTSQGSGVVGNNSVFDNQTALGGGFGKGGGSSGVGGNGGSGGGGARTGVGGTGSQGNNGGTGLGVGLAGGGGGGKGSAGSGQTAGSGQANSITGASVTYAAGKNGGNGTGGASGANGTANTGDGGGGGGGGGASVGGNGGSGVVILRIPTGDYTGTTTGSPTVTIDGSFTVVKFTSSGSYSA